MPPQGLDHARKPLDLRPDRSQVPLLLGTDFGARRLVQREPEKLQVERHRVERPSHIVGDLLEQAGHPHEVSNEEALLDLAQERSVAECGDGDAGGIGRLVHELVIPGTRDSGSDR